MTSEDLLKIADMAMYKAKGSGKNRYRIFDEGVQQEVEEKLKIELNIRECLDKEEFQLFFQPMYNTKNDRITCVEALLRTQHWALSFYKGFVDTMLQSEKDSKIIKSIIKLAHNIELKVVAEGVEDKK